jgi:hypothetical protein
MRESSRALNRVCERSGTLEPHCGSRPAFIPADVADQRFADLELQSNHAIRKSVLVQPADHLDGRIRQLGALVILTNTQTAII